MKDKSGEKYNPIPNQFSSHKWKKFIQLLILNIFYPFVAYYLTIYFYKNENRGKALFGVITSFVIMLIMTLRIGIRTKGRWGWN